MTVNATVVTALGPDGALRMTNALAVHVSLSAPSSLDAPARAVAAAMRRAVSDGSLATALRELAPDGPLARVAARVAESLGASSDAALDAIEGMTHVVSSSPSSRAGDGDAPARGEIIADADDGLDADLYVARIPSRRTDDDTVSGDAIRRWDLEELKREKRRLEDGGMSHSYDFAFSLTYEAETHESGDDTAIFSASYGDVSAGDDAFSADYDTGAFSASYGGEIHESDDAISYDYDTCLLYTSPSPRDGLLSRMPSSA